MLLSLLLSINPQPFALAALPISWAGRVPRPRVRQHSCTGLEAKGGVSVLEEAEQKHAGDQEQPSAGARAALLCAVQAEAERSCRPASCSASEHPGRANNCAKAAAVCLLPAARCCLHHELPVTVAVLLGTRIVTPMVGQPTLPCAWALGLWLPLETCFILLISQHNSFCGFLELSQDAGKLQMFFITGQVFMGCSGAGSIRASGLNLQLGN